MLAILFRLQRVNPCGADNRIQCTHDISPSHISWNWIWSHVGPHFFAHPFPEFCRYGIQGHDIFCKIAVIPWMPFTGENLSQNLLAEVAFDPVYKRQFLLIQCKPDISQSCISWNWIYRGRMLDPIFLPTDFANFADVAPKSAIFFAKSR